MKHSVLYTSVSWYQTLVGQELSPCQLLWLLQDTPAAKLTYAAAITVPNKLTALMSAVPQGGSEPSAGSPDSHTFHFKQDVPIPSYLLALAVGELEYRQIGPKSKVTANHICSKGICMHAGRVVAFDKLLQSICL